MVKKEILIIESKKKIYKFNVISINENKIEFNTYSHSIKKTVNVDLDLIKYSLNKLNSTFSKIEVESPESRKKISEKIIDYTEFIEIINHSNQIEEALLQMMSLIWNNKWIMNFAYAKNTIKKFLSDYGAKSEVCKCYYLLLFLLESVEKVKFKDNYQNSKEINLLDWELDNFNYLDYLENDDELVLDFIIQ